MKIFFWEKKKCNEINTKTPCKKLTDYYLKKYGKFPLNRVRQLDIKLRKKKKLSNQELTFIRVCLMQLLKQDENLFINNDKNYACWDL
jgi:hypothetical protein